MDYVVDWIEKYQDQIEQLNNADLIVEFTSLWARIERTPVEETMYEMCSAVAIERGLIS